MKIHEYNLNSGSADETKFTCVREYRVRMTATARERHISLFHSQTANYEDSHVTGQSSHSRNNVVFSRLKRRRPAAAANTHILEDRSDISSDEQHSAVGFRHCRRLHSNDRSYKELRSTDVRHISPIIQQRSVNICRSKINATINLRHPRLSTNTHRPSDVIRRGGRSEGVPEISEA